MALSDRYTKPDTRSKFEKWLDSLSDSNRATVDEWLGNPALGPGVVAEMIREDDEDDGFTGYRCNRDTITAWRRNRVAR